MKRRTTPGTAGLMGAAVAAWLVLVYSNRFIRAAAGFLAPPDGRPNRLPPFEPSFAGVTVALGRDVSALVAAGLVAAASFGAGALVLPFLCGGRRAGRAAPQAPRRSGFAATRVAALALGAGIAGTALFGLGLAGLLRPPILVTALAAGTMAGLRLFRRFPRAPGETAVRGGGKGVRFLLVAVMAVAAAGMVVSALAPEIEVDSLHYHLARAGAWLASGRIAPGAWPFPHELSALWECLLVPALAVGGEAGARLLNPLCAVLVAFALARFPGGTAGLVAGALWLSSLGLGAAANTSKNDVAVALFGFLAFASAMRGSRGRAFLAGIFAGLAVSVKLTGGVSVAAALAALALRPGDRSRRAALFMAGATAAAAPWLVKNLLNTGNPLFPLAPQWLGGGLTGLELETMEHEVRSYLAFGYSGLSGRLAAPWTLAVGYSATAVPALVVAALGFLLARPDGPGMAGAGARWAVAALVSVAGWLAGPPQFRFLIQSLPLFCGAVATGLAVPAPARRRLPGPAFSRLPVLFALLAAAEAGLSWLDPGADRVARSMVATGLSSPASFLATRLPACAETAAWASANLPPRSVVLLYGELRAFHLGRRTLVPWYGRPAPFLEMAAESPDAHRLGVRLRQLSATHLLINRTHAMYRRAFMQRLDPGERAMRLWASWWRDHARLAYEPPVISAWTGSYSLYELDHRGGRPGPRPLLLPGLETWLNRPEELVAAGRTTEALAEFGRVERVAGDFPVVKLAKAVIFERALPRGQARALLQEAHAAGLRSVTLLVTLARYAREDGDAAGARRLLEEAAKLDPEFRPHQ